MEVAVLLRDVQNRAVEHLDDRLLDDVHIGDDAVDRVGPGQVVLVLLQEGQGALEAAAPLVLGHRPARRQRLHAQLRQVGQAAPAHGRKPALVGVHDRPSTIANSSMMTGTWPSTAGSSSATETRASSPGRTTTSWERPSAMSTSIARRFARPSELALVLLLQAQVRHVGRLVQQAFADEDLARRRYLLGAECAVFPHDDSSHDQVSTRNVDHAIPIEAQRYRMAGFG